VNSAKVVLLVEDNPSDVALAMRALKKARIVNEVLVAEDGEAALDLVLGPGEANGEGPELPALILLDVKLPKVSGLEVLRRIRENPRTRRLPVVILTTSNEPSDIATGYDLGVNSYVTKPVDFIQFARAVEQLGLYWLLLNEPPPSVK
jgi:CheY-like chemotaxis protein